MGDMNHIKIDNFYIHNIHPDNKFTIFDQTEWPNKSFMLKLWWINAYKFDVFSVIL